MNVREKLVELLESARYWGSNTSEEVADSLIAYGVTVPEWISVEDRLPKEEWERWCAGNDWDVYPCLAVIKPKRGDRYVMELFFTGENFVDDVYTQYTAQVTHWMPLPKPPKEDKQC